MVNFGILAKVEAGNGGVGVILKEFLLINFTTGPGLTGWIMNFALGTMVWFAMELVVPRMSRSSLKRRMWSCIEPERPLWIL